MSSSGQLAAVLRHTQEEAEQLWLHPTPPSCRATLPLAVPRRRPPRLSLTCTTYHPAFIPCLFQPTLLDVNLINITPYRSVMHLYLYVRLHIHVAGVVSS